MVVYSQLRAYTRTVLTAIHIMPPFALLRLPVVDDIIEQAEEGIEMSARDYHHDTVKRALLKAGWQIAGEQVTLILPIRRLWVDMRAISPRETLPLLVEVKSFENLSSPVEYLTAAVGKYILYEAAIEDLGIDGVLYMALPTHAFEGIMAEPVGQLLRQRVHIRMIVFDPISEEIVEWIP
jgi:hypothetical protein